MYYIIFISPRLKRMSKIWSPTRFWFTLSLHFFAPYLHRVNFCKSNFSCNELSLKWESIISCSTLLLHFAEYSNNTNQRKKEINTKQQSARKLLDEFVREIDVSCQQGRERNILGEQRQLLTNEYVLVQKEKSAIIISRKCFKRFIHSTFRCKFPHCMKDFRSGKSFNTIWSRKINFILWFSQSLVEIHYWNLYSEKIIMLGFHLDVRTVKIFFASELSFTLCKGIQDRLGFQVLDSSICQ